MCRPASSRNKLASSRTATSRTVYLKHSQYKNDATQLKNFLGLKLPPFSFTVHSANRGVNKYTL